MILIPAGNPSTPGQVPSWAGPTGNNTYLLTGATPALIDAGVGLRTHLDAVEAALAGRALSVVLLTHSHSDHASGVPALLERWPEAIVRPDSQPLHDHESLAAGDGTLVAMHTPGHAPDHFCFVDEERREVYCGDLIRAGGTIVIPASRGGDLRAYLNSLRRVRDLRPRRLWPGHGPVIDDPDAVLEEYLAHRARREAQIVDALRGGPRTVEEIVLVIYRDLAETLAPAAAETVLAHLRKLEQDGRAAFTGSRWHLSS